MASINFLALVVLLLPMVFSNEDLESSTTQYDGNTDIILMLLKNMQKEIDENEKTGEDTKIGYEIVYVNL